MAKPSPEELKAVHHYFIDSHSIHETVNAAVFEKYALEKADEIFSHNDVAVMVGGTGLYIKTFCEGIDEVPQVAEGLRESIIADYQENGLEWLQQQVQNADPLYFATGEIKNPHRLMRALEVKLSTGRSILEFQSQKKQTRDFNIIRIGLELPRPELYERINTRVLKMVEMGLVEEARLLAAEQHLNALQTVGYRELFDHFEGRSTLPQAIESIQTNTRHYAKRQLTWFKKDPEMHWMAPEFEMVMAFLKKMPA